MFKYPVTVRLTIDKAAPKFVKAEVLGKKSGKKQKVFWHDTFDMYDPYQTRKVEMFAQPAFIEPIKSNADHTYAVGYDNGGKRKYLWPCGGDHDENQRSIGTGEAFQPECDCLSQMRVDPLTHGLAGVRYGYDGVCHQATNRIVCPAGLEVRDAKGYMTKGWKYLTYTLYGRLGIKHKSGLAKWERIKTGCLTKTYPRCSEDVTLLTHPDDHEGLTQSHVDHIQARVEKARKAMGEIYARLAGGRLTPQEYADAMNGHINTFKNDLVPVLGADLHSAIFEEVADEDVVVVIPHMAERVFAKGVPDDI